MSHGPAVELDTEQELNTFEAQVPLSVREQREIQQEMHWEHESMFNCVAKIAQQRNRKDLVLLWGERRSDEQRRAEVDEMFMAARVNMHAPR